MTLPALTAIRSIDTIDAPARLVLYTLTSYAGETGLCWPSVPTLVKDTGLSRRSVYNALAALEAAGLVTRRHPPTHPGTVYDLAGLGARAGAGRGAPRAPGVHLVHEGGAPDDLKGCTSCTLTDQEEIKEEIARVRARRATPADVRPEAVEEFTRAISPPPPPVRAKTLSPATRRGPRGSETPRR